MDEIAANLEYLRTRVPATVRIVAVSKTKSPVDIMAAYNCGQRMFGENRVQELLSKKDKLPADIQWHMLGHLQTNKVKQIIPFISLIQSVDSMKLLSAVDAESYKAGRITDCLLQVRIAREETKFGFPAEEIDRMFGSGEITGLKNISIRGVMGMATFTDDAGQVRSEFRMLADIFKSIKSRYFQNDPNFNEISMGMSGDYMIAVEEGSTMIRVGSLIFGKRNSNKQNNG